MEPQALPCKFEADIPSAPSSPSPAFGPCHSASRPRTRPPHGTTGCSLWSPVEAIAPRLCPWPAGRRADNYEELVQNSPIIRRPFLSLNPGLKTSDYRSKLPGSPNQKLACPQGRGQPGPGCGVLASHAARAQQPSGQVPRGQLDSRQADTGAARARGLQEASEAGLPCCSGITNTGLWEAGAERLPRAKSSSELLSCLALSSRSACVSSMGSIYLHPRFLLGGVHGGRRPPAVTSGYSQCAGSKLTAISHDLRFLVSHMASLGRGRIRAQNPPSETRGVVEGI